MREIQVVIEDMRHAFRQRAGFAPEDPEAATEWFRLLPSGREEATGIWYMEGETEEETRLHLLRWLEQQPNR